MERTQRALPRVTWRLPDRKQVYQLLERGAADDPASRATDACLVGLILISLAATVLESVPAFSVRWQAPLFWVEVISVVVFTGEYVLRVACAIERPEERYHHPVWGRLRYALSPLALADLLAIFPFYLSAFVQIDLRMLRLVRLLRILKLTHYFSALETLMDVLKMERNALGAAYFVVAVGIVLASTGIYVFEHEAQPEHFSSVPAAIYWSIVTLSTVGYGDIVPVTTGGRVMSAIVIMLGVGTLTVPAGIMSTGFALELRRRRARLQGDRVGDESTCPGCGQPGPPR